jgi:hypothetical protein
MNQELNPSEPPHVPSPECPVAPGSPTRPLPLALACALLLVPPLASSLSVGLGLFIDSLHLGPTGFLFVLILIGPGSLAAGVCCAVGIARYLSNGSRLAFVCLVVSELSAVVFSYSLWAPYLRGWG